MTKKKVKLFTFDGCDYCDDALHDLLPIVKKKEIPLHIVSSLEEGIGFLLPRTCITKEDGSEKCIEGWDETYKKEMEGLLE